MSGVEVKASSRHSRGVFATRNFKMGEFVCTFAGQKKLRTEVTRTEMDYVLDLDAETYDVGFIVPKTAIGLGQLINDVACPDFEVGEGKLEDQLKALAVACAKYLQTCQQHNVIADGRNYFASKDIPTGTEVVTWYGVETWLNHFILRGTLEQQVALTLFEAAYAECRDTVLMMMLEKKQQKETSQAANVLLSIGLREVKWSEYTVHAAQLGAKLKEIHPPSERVHCGFR